VSPARDFDHIGTSARPIVTGERVGLEIVLELFEEPL
jgi:hypothetical protein